MEKAGGRETEYRKATYPGELMCILPRLGALQINGPDRPDGLGGVRLCVRRAASPISSYGLR